MCDISNTKPLVPSFRSNQTISSQNLQRYLNDIDFNQLTIREPTVRKAGKRLEGHFFSKPIHC